MDKVYTPDVIAENPFPSGGETSEVKTTTQSATTDIFSPTKTTERVFPIKRRATEVLSTSLNTRSRKILQEFQLEQSGGIQIGNFQEGVTGDLRLTPNGMTARNVSGNTTFSIDGADGSAVFLGNVQAGSFLAGDSNVVIESVEDSDGSHGRILIDNQILIGYGDF